jgi:DNA-binding transcriptional MerR regulator
MANRKRQERLDTSLTSAQCAERTGLTIRALRVYERSGLLKAKRSANGWRHYGLPEIERLNTVVVMKSLGMTLAQIRALLKTGNHSLQQVFELQVKAWQAKQAEVSRGLFLAETALNRVQTEQSLSINEICELINRLTMVDAELRDQIALGHELRRETFTAEEYKTLRTFIRKHFDIEQLVAQFKSETIAFKKLQQLMATGSAPNSKEVQQLLIERNSQLLRCEKNRRALKIIEWNADLGVRYFAMDLQLIQKMQAQPKASPDPRIILTPKVWEYFWIATMHAPWAQPTVKLIEDAKRLLANKSDPRSNEAHNLARRFADLYIKYQVGEPLVEAKLIRYWEAIYSGWPDWAGQDNKAAWLFLSDAVCHHLGAMETGV